MTRPNVVAHTKHYVMERIVDDSGEKSFVNWKWDSEQGEYRHLPPAELREEHARVVANKAVFQERARTERAWVETSCKLGFFAITFLQSEEGYEQAVAMRDKYNTEAEAEIFHPLQWRAFVIDEEAYYDSLVAGPEATPQ